MFSRASREGQGAASLFEDMQGHNRGGIVRAPIAHVSNAEHKVAFWESRFVVYGRRGAGTVQSSLHGLKRVTQQTVETGI